MPIALNYIECILRHLVVVRGSGMTQIKSRLFDALWQVYAVYTSKTDKVITLYSVVPVTYITYP